MKSIPTLLAVLGVSSLMVVALVWVSATDFSPEAELIQNEAGAAESFSGPFVDEDKATRNLNPMEKTSEANPVAVFTTNQGVIEVELFQDQMPITVGNFVKLTEEGYYDGTKFHRVIPNFMIQGGDPNTKGDNTASYGTGGPGYTIQDEFVEGELLTNVTGTIAMANTGQPNSGGSQFFINVADNTFLDFNNPQTPSAHPVFGRVINGMDVVTTIEQVETGARDIPVEPVVIESITIR
jgi:peptidylprolyl isomerase